MTNGISVNDMVAVKATGEIGRVVAIDDHADRLPADLQVDFQVQGSYNNERLSVYGIEKLRVDEVIRVTVY